MNVVGAIFLTLLLSPVAYWLFDNQPPYTFLTEGSYVTPPVAKGGDQAIVTWKVKFHRSCPGSNLRTLFDPNTGVIVASYDAAPVATTSSLKNGYLNRSFLLPKNIQTGLIGYRATVSYQCNPLQKFWPLVVTTPDLFFKIEE